ncbi:MAG: UDP-N-acetyl-D-glucosamine dehydrogenase [Candidatus Omnitrophica bacterium CG1_02_44_16]|nr:MAG: UDP-N-acetyl-D-glucosamine dehydrogenase [Candidatus Omnitrophica bacterium CG1_02_44_16]PIY83784.1 MAG: UDP-N-acetyl-D-glucosamine dehydrogenase [Candidatus Omnitrophica bacterium CG_4_10_14_0_8_um_filter_44_12]PIZ83110.1 MAG: UDP-N-acetyl-D-glucosamine dehydrogenase [Candidatus Omnitrophica bacterium CG_4_10_14_0_2_um_filter_44_9]
MKLVDKIRQRKIRSAVIGLGYVGLPLAVELAEAGVEVVGIDLDKSKIDAINNKKSYIQDVPTSKVKALVEKGMLTATNVYSALMNVDTINICVPTPLRKTKEPDISYIVKSSEQIARYLKKGQLIILESTTYPGTTDEVLLPMFEAKGLKVGKDFFLAFSPERVDPANPQFNTRNIPKVVGGVTPACTEAAKALYELAIDTVFPVSSTRVAETVKLLENTFRSVNIGLVNELALMCDKMKINVWEVIDAAKTKPFGYMAFYPGPGIGGHCIPLDPYYLSWKARLFGFEARMIELAGQINGSMPEHVVTKVGDALNERGKSIKGAKILILGVAYKKNVSDFRESPAFEVIHFLNQKGAAVSYSDPHVPSIKEDGVTMKSVKLTPEALKKSDCVVVITDHAKFDYSWIVQHANLILDTRNAIKAKSAKVVKL